MFDRFEVWLIAGIVAFVVFCALDSWIIGMRHKIKEQKGAINRLRYELDTKKQEVSWLQARCESRTEHRVIIRDTQIDELREELEKSRNECKRLETVLNQKWKVVTEDDLQVG